MSAADTTSSNDEARSEMVAAYCDRLWNGTRGWVFVGVGYDPEKVGPDKVKHKDWREQAWRWPDQRHGLLDYIVTESRERDVYTTPGLSENPVRDSKKRRPRPSRFLWGDLDGASEAQLIQMNELMRAGSFTVASGRGPTNLHPYVMLEELTAPADVEQLNRRLVALVGGDPSPSALNGYLRPAGTYNFKPAVLRGEQPALVMLATDTSGTGWSTSHLDELLPPARRRPSAEEEQAAEQPLPDPLPERVANVLQEGADGVTDRSGRTMALVGACRSAGLTLGQTLTAARHHAPTRARFGGADQLDVDGLQKDVRRCWSKLSDAAEARAGAEHAKAFFDGDTFVPARLGAFIRAEGHVCLGHDGRLYRYEGGVYRGDGDAFVRSRVCGLLGERVRRRHQDEVMAWTRADFPTIAAQPPVDTLNLANGLLDWRTGEFGPHTPEFLSAVQVPVAWHPEATCPTALGFLTDVLPDDAVDFVIEIMGYALYPGNPFAKALLLLGPGGNGKSKLLALIGALLGERNTSAVTLQTFSENRFAAAEVYGKLANVAGDLDARAIKRTDTFKMITGGDPVTAEHKYGHAFRFTSFALPIFSANEAPISSDQSEAWFSRWLVVPMEQLFRGTDRDDPHIGGKITRPAELEGLLVRAVEGLRRLMIRGRFELPKSVRQAGDQYRAHLDTVRAFVDEECVLHPEAWASRRELYQAYRKWVEEGGRLPVSAQTFTDHLRRGYVMRVDERTRRGARGWGGIGLAATELS